MAFQALTHGKEIQIPSETKLDFTLALLESREANQVFKTSLVRLLRGCPDQRKWPVLMRLVQKDPSPLVRASAASALAGSLTPETLQALLAARTRSKQGSPGSQGPSSQPSKSKSGAGDSKTQL